MSDFTSEVDEYLSQECQHSYVRGWWQRRWCCECHGDDVAELMRLRERLMYLERFKAAVESSMHAAGDRYMDPPDGGSVSVPEQITRMVEEAASEIRASRDLFWLREQVRVMDEIGLKRTRCLFVLVGDAHCDDDECSYCSVRMCPHGDALHLHHDGCPSCLAASEDGR